MMLCMRGYVISGSTDRQKVLNVLLTGQLHREVPVIFILTQY